MCFNGAAADVPRSAKTDGNTVRRSFCASMGPRLMCRGAWAVRDGLAILYRASMGPRLMCRGADRDTADALRGMAALQWGRG